jgi:outer membrane protein TolC
MPRFGLSLYGRAGPGGQLIRVDDVDGNEYLVQGTPPIDDGIPWEPRLGYGAALSAEQRVYDFGRTSAAIDAAEAEADSAEASVTAARRRVVREVRLTYLGWLAAVLAQRGTEDSLERARQRRRQVEGRVAEGLRPASDAAAATQQELTLELEALKQRGRVAAARLGLERAAATTLPRDAVPDPRLLERKPPRTSAPAAELLALRKRADALFKHARARERGAGPELIAQANLGVRGQNELFAPYYDVTLAFSMPLWDGGAGAGRARAEQARAAATLAESRELDGALRVERALALSDFESARKRALLCEKLHALALQRLSGAAERYDAGSATFEVVLDAEDEPTRAEQELYSARLARAEAALRLEP